MPLCAPGHQGGRPVAAGAGSDMQSLAFLALVILTVYAAFTGLA
jgi:hypothetical protein